MYASIDVKKKKKCLVVDVATDGQSSNPLLVVPSGGRDLQLGSQSTSLP